MHSSLVCLSQCPSPISRRLEVISVRSRLRESTTAHVPTRAAGRFDHVLRFRPRGTVTAAARQREISARQWDKLTARNRGGIGSQGRVGAPQQALLCHRHSGPLPRSNGIAVAEQVFPVLLDKALSNACARSFSPVAAGNQGPAWGCGRPFFIS
jgi:hypothetical protein